MKSMVSILFVCHGNICRSPMAESVLRFAADFRGVGDRVRVDSAATRRDELGNPPHRGTVRKLREEGVPLVPHRARLLTCEDGEKFDYLIGMDAENRADMRRILGKSGEGKLFLLGDFTGAGHDIDDPWYTGDFDGVYEEILTGVNALLDKLFPVSG